MLIDARARPVTSGAEVLREFKRVRAKLMGRPAPEPLSEVEPEPQPLPPENEKPAKSAIVPLPIIFQIVDLVAAQANSTPERIFLEVEVGGLIEARMIAIAVASLSMGLSDDTIVQHFGVQPAVVRLAVRRAAPIYLSAAIPSGASLAGVIAILFKNWAVEISAAGRPSIDDIKREVCAQFSVAKRDIDSDRRTLNVVVPRQIAMALAKRLTGCSLPYIGRHIGNRDHTTVLHACTKLAPQIEAAGKFLPDGATLAEWVRAVRTSYEGREGRA